MVLLIHSIPCISFIFGCTGLECEEMLYEIMCPESFGESDLTFDPSLRSNRVNDI